MKEKLEDEMLHTIVVPAKQLIWVKYKKEIRVGEKMFDVKSMRVENENYIFTGLFDDEETALNNYLENYTDQKNDSGSQLLSSLFQLLQSSFIEGERCSLITDVAINTYPLFTLQHISFPFKNILTPPPQQFSMHG